MKQIDAGSSPFKEPKKHESKEPPNEEERAAIERVKSGKSTQLR